MPRCSISERKWRAQVVVEAAQDVLAAIDQRHLRAEAVEDAGELDRDIAAALHQDALRQLLEVEGLVRGDHVLDARDGRAHMRARLPVAIRMWPARMRWPVALSSTRMRVLQNTARSCTMRDAGAFQRWPYRPLRAGRSRGPCWRSGSASRSSARGDGPAVAGGILEFVGKARLA